MAIEVDGESHNDRETYDKVRDEELRHKGINVIRFYNDDVINNTEGVYEDIYEIIKKWEHKNLSC